MKCRAIMLVVDPAMRRTPAYDRAVQLVCRSGATLHLLLFEHDSAIENLGLVNAELMALARRARIQEREEWLHDLALELQSRHIDVRTGVVWGRPVHEQIVLEAMQRRIDLLIKDRGEETGLRRLLFTPLDWQLLRLCPMPLLLVNGTRRNVSHRVMAAVDPVRSGSEVESLDEHIVDAAQWLCEMERAQLHLLHAYGGVPPLPPVDAMASMEIFNQAYEQLRQLHRQRFAALAAQQHLPEGQQHFVDELPQDAIPRLSHVLQVDALVLGTIHRIGLGRVLMGSTAERVLSQVDCDVLAVKPKGFIADLREQLRAEAYDRAFAEYGLP